MYKPKWRESKTKFSFWTASNNVNELRRYFVKFLGRERVLQLSDTAINDLLTIRANDLYLHYQELSRHRINTIPLKIIIQGLKFNEN